MRLISGFRLALIAALGLALSGCFNAFNVVDDNFKPKARGSIAVITGVPDDVNVVVSTLISESLRKQSRYQVMTPQQIAQAVKPYPQLIKGPYSSAYFEIDVDWTLTDKQKLTAIQRALGVDYLFVLWAPTAVSYSSTKGPMLQVIGQLFQFPGAKEVGQSKFQLYFAKDDPSYVKKGTEEVARQIADRTGMLAASSTAQK